MSRKIQNIAEDNSLLMSQEHFRNPFSLRVERFWQWFREHSDTIENSIQQKRNDSEEINALMNDGLSIIGEDIYYNIGGHNELTFCIEEHTECHHLYPYLVASMPEDLGKKWTVFPCKQPDDTAGFVLNMYGKGIDMSELKVSPTYDNEGNHFDLQYFHPVFAELNEQECLSALYLIIELTIGEGASYNYINQVYKADNDKDMIPVSKLAETMKTIIEANGKKYSTKPESSYFSYSCQPDEEEKRLRLDIVCGTSRYMALNHEYAEGGHYIYDSLVAKGAAPIMLIMIQPEVMTVEEFLDMRYQVEDHLIELFRNSTIKGQFLGGAYGATGTAYIDLLLYDGRQFIDYISKDDMLCRILSQDTDGSCPVQLLLKEFTQDSRVYRLNNNNGKTWWNRLFKPFTHKKQ